MNDSDYHEFETVTIGEQWTVAADTTQVAFGRRDGDVTLLGPDGRETVTVASPLSDIDLSRYLLTLSDEEVSAYTTSGVELWSQSVPGATAVVGIEGRDVLAVLTADGTVVGLDLETGGRLFETGRPHDDFSDTHLAAGSDRLCIGAWSFVVCFDARGSVVFDRNLDSTVEDVSVLDDRVLATLKDGTIVALDAESGDQHWSNSASIRRLSPGGEGPIPALTDSGVAMVHAEGRLEQADIDAGGRIVGTTDGQLVAVTDDTSATVYRRGPPPSAQLAATVLTERIDDQTPIRVSVENTGSTAIERTVELETAQPLELGSRHAQVTLEPGQSREVAYRVRSLPSADRIECTLTVDGDELTTTTIAAVRELTLSEAVSVSLDPERIVDGTVVVGSTVENVSDVTLEAVKVGQQPVRRLEAGSSLTAEHEYPLDGRDRTVSVELTQRNATHTVDSRVSVPDSAVRVDIDRGDDTTPCIDISVQPSLSVQTRGEFVVDLPGDRTLSRQVALEEHERHVLAVVLPPAVAARDEIPVRVSSPLLDDDRQARIPGWEVATATADSRHRESRPQASRDQRQSSRQPARDRSTGRHASQTETRASQSEPPEVTVERKTPETAALGTRFTERLRVANESSRPVTDVSVSDSFDQFHIDRIDAGSAVVLTRYHTLFETGEHRLPPVDVADTRSRPREIHVVEPEIRMQAAPVDGNTLGLAVENDSHTRCELTRLAVKTGPDDEPESEAFAEPLVVESGEQTTITHRFDGLSAARTTREILVEYRHGGAADRRVTLAPPGAADGGTQTTVDTRLLDKSRLVAGVQGVVEVAIENDTAVSFQDATLGVEGDIVLDTALSQDSKTVPAFEPGETETLLVDVMPDGADQEAFDVVVEGTAEGEQVTQRQTFSGPVAETGEEWEQHDYLDQWGTAEDDATVRIGETHLTTRFRPTEEGSRQ